MTDATARYVIAAQDQTGVATKSAISNFKALNKQVREVGSAIRGFAGVGTGLFGIGFLTRGLNQIQEMAKGWTKTSEAIKEYNAALNNPAAKETLDDIAAAWVKIKTVVAEATLAVIAYDRRAGKDQEVDRFSRSKAAINASDALRLAPDITGPIGARGIDPGTKLTIQQNAVDALNKATASLRTEDEKYIAGLLDQKRAIEDLVTRYPQLADEAQKWLDRVNEQLPSMTLDFKELNDVTVDLTAAQDDFNASLQESLTNAGLLKDVASTLKEITEEEDSKRQARIAAREKEQDQIREKIKSVTDAIGEGIEGAVTRGETSFKGFLRSIISGLESLILKNAIKKLGESLQAAFTPTGTSSSGGIIGFLGSLFGGLFAKGGDPPVGKASIVGENGPEWFIPKSAGTIIPNGGGRGGVVLNLVQNFGIQVDAVQRSELAPWGKGIAQQAVNTVSNLIRRGRYT